MPRVSEIEIDRFLDRLYGAAVEPGAWDHAMKALMDLYRSDMSHMVMHDDESGQPHAVNCHGYDVALYERLGSHYMPRDPLRSRMSNLLAGDAPSRSAPMAIHAANLLPHAELAETEYYRDFGRFTGFDDSLFIGGTKAVGRSFWLVVNAGVGRTFDEDEVHVAESISLHVRRAMNLHEQIGRTDGASGVGRYWQDSPVALILSSDGKVSFENNAAIALLSSGEPVVRRHARLRFRDPTIQDAYDQLMQPRRLTDIAQSHALAFQAQGEGNARWLVQLITLRPAWQSPWSSLAPLVPSVLVAITPLNVMGAARQRAIDGFVQLTEAEREVLRLLVQGLSAEAIARVSGRRVATVRWHIRSLIGKLQATSVADVVRIGALVLPF